MSGAFADCELLSHLPDIIGGLEKWQTLASAILALLAAIVGAILLNRQTRVSYNIHKDSIARRHQAAKIMITPILMNIAQVHSDLIVNISIYHLGLEQNNTAKIAALLPNIRSTELNIQKDQIEFINNYIESLSDKNEVNHVGEIFSLINLNKITFRVFTAKLNCENNDYDIEVAAKIIILSATILHLCKSLDNSIKFNDSRMFPFSNSENQKVHWKYIETYAAKALKNTEAPTSLVKETLAQIELARNSGHSPWTSQ